MVKEKVFKEGNLKKQITSNETITRVSEYLIVLEPEKISGVTIWKSL